MRSITLKILSISAIAAGFTMMPSILPSAQAATSVQPNIMANLLVSSNLVTTQLISADIALANSSSLMPLVAIQSGRRAGRGGRGVRGRGFRGSRGRRGGNRNFRGNRSFRGNRGFRGGRGFRGNRGFRGRGFRSRGFNRGFRRGGFGFNKGFGFNRGFHGGGFGHGFHGGHFGSGFGTAIIIDQAGNGTTRSVGSSIPSLQSTGRLNGSQNAPNREVIISNLSGDFQPAYQQCLTALTTHLGSRNIQLSAPDQPQNGGNVGENSWRFSTEVTTSDGNGGSFLRTMTCEANSTTVSYLEIE